MGEIVDVLLRKHIGIKGKETNDMTYETLDEILADIGKSNVTPKHLIQAAFELGSGAIPRTGVEEVVEEIEEVS